MRLAKIKRGCLSPAGILPFYQICKTAHTKRTKPEKGTNYLGTLLRDPTYLVLQLHNCLM